MKLTKRQRECLALLLDNFRHETTVPPPTKAMFGKLVRMGLAEFKAGYPRGWAITPAGRAALSQTEGDGE